MNKCLAAGWLVFVFVSALTESFHDMVVSQTVSFRFTPHPDVSGFFVFDMAELAIPEAAIQKLGHAFSFFVLAYLFFRERRRMKRAVLYALAAAFLTEIVQLFFGRNGCLRDVLIDSLGIAAFCALQRKKHTAKHTKTGSL
ncbi:putative integral inner membrane protein [Bacillus velezensis UCMB5036]|uniref:VanZ family protein n=1 Tax=Bacillus TaxID=1386 RepID=UPI0002B6BE77|nr:MULTISPECIES: VanZ family protein [Bacillus]AIU83554.1 putative membrane protein YwnJ [Bacillus velezensis]AMQ72062.1 membrane protein [Bacillus amyloliquefaciens UMAF6614]ASK60105.1 VanZ family protein [Bacillus velezensis]ATD74753.1 putative membrane protein YwnJ [Bacillus velezensis]ATV24472.1 VanZ family protein [Bacillus sp. Lzh-5]